MFNPNNQNNQTDKNNSIYETLENDLYMNFMFEQPQQLHNGLSRLPNNQQMPSLLPPPYHQQFIFPGTVWMDQQSIFDRGQNLIFGDYPKIPLKEEQVEQQMQEEPKQKKVKKQTQHPQMSEEKNDSKNAEFLQNKNNLKNTYINKISSLINQDGQLTANDIKGLTESTTKSKSVKTANSNSFECKREDFDPKNSNNAKLQRNRECARNSRKRKKVYIELLENKVKLLQDELDKTKRHLQSSLSSNQDQQQLQGYLMEKQQLLEKLEKQLNVNPDHYHINMILDSMRDFVLAEEEKRGQMPPTIYIVRFQIL